MITGLVVTFIIVILAIAGFLMIPTPVAAVCRRELYTLINGPIGLVSLIAFLVISQTMYAVVIFKTYGEASMRPFFEKIPLAFSLVAPLVAMRMWAEERRTHTIELLLTLPNTTWAAVLGKFSAGWIFLAACLFFTLSTPIMLETVLTEKDTVVTNTGADTSAATATPKQDTPSTTHASDKTIVRHGPDWGPIIGGYAGSLLLAAFTLAIGSFTSAITRDQIVAAILGIMICLILWAFGYQLVINVLNEIRSGTGSFLAGFSHQQRFLNLAKGLWDWTDVLFFLSGTGVFLWLTSVVVEKQRA